MFHETQQLSALTELNVAYAISWQAPDLDRLVSSCSNLQTLSMCCSPGLQLTPLRQLAALTHLWLTGATAYSTVTSLKQLSALQGLQELFVLDPWRSTDDAVRSLTALTQLTSLGLSDNEDVFGRIMQQQLRQQFVRVVADGPSLTRQIINNTVST